MTVITLGSFVQSRRAGHLATVDGEGRPVVVPVCFATDGRVIYSAVDEKPKRSRPGELARLRNVRANPEVALVLDVYDEDWRRLRFTLIRGRARVLLSGKEHGQAVRLLRMKYPQYRKMGLESRPIMKIVPWRLFEWSSR